MLVGVLATAAVAGGAGFGKADGCVGLWKLNDWYDAGPELDPKRECRLPFKASNPGERAAALAAGL